MKWPPSRQLAAQVLTSHESQLLWEKAALHPLPPLHTLPMEEPAASSTAFTLRRAWWVWGPRPPSARAAGEDPGTMPTEPDTNTMPLALMACHTRREGGTATSQAEGARGGMCIKN